MEIWAYLKIDSYQISLSVTKITEKHNIEANFTLSWNHTAHEYGVHPKCVTRQFKNGRKNIKAKTQIYFQQNVKALIAKKTHLQREAFIFFLFSVLFEAPNLTRKMQIYQQNYFEEPSLFFSFPVYSLSLFVVFSISKWIPLSCTQSFELGICHFPQHSFYILRDATYVT